MEGEHIVTLFVGGRLHAQDLKVDEVKLTAPLHGKPIGAVGLPPTYVDIQTGIGYKLEVLKGQAPRMDLDGAPPVDWHCPYYHAVGMNSQEAQGAILDLAWRRLFYNYGYVASDQPPALANGHKPTGEPAEAVEYFMAWCDCGDECVKDTLKSRAEFARQHLDMGHHVSFEAPAPADVEPSTVEE
jgi:hypothetical protein